MNEHTRIEICGGLASGKTTLCQLLGTSGLETTFENFKANPFWSAFYQNPVKYAFETEITFLLQHYSQIKTCLPQTEKLACDFSLLQDRAYADLNLANGRLSAFRSVYTHIMRELPPARLLIHLKCDVDEELSRIRGRGREEEANIDPSYLNALNEAISRAVGRANRKTRVLTVDSAAIDFAHDQKSQTDLLRIILGAIGQYSAY